MRNSAKFLEAFAIVEKSLRSSTRSDRNTPFYQLVDLASASSPNVRRYRETLKEYADLRNAITHERSGGEPIAEPHDRVVSDLQRLAQLLLNPPKVLPTFGKRVQTIDPKDPISAVLPFFLPENFSQIPVLSGGKLAGLLTSNTLSRWLASQVTHEVVDLTEHRVADALKFTEYTDNWRVLARDTTLTEVIDAFDMAEQAGKRLDAILLTHGGRATEALLGIITIHDMPKVLRHLSRKTRTRTAA